MKELFSERPAATWLEVLNEKTGAPCVVHFTENIKEVEAEDQDGKAAKSFTADSYEVTTSYREGLLEAVEADRDVWLAAAKAAEGIEAKKTLEERVADLETMTEDMVQSILNM